MKTEPLIASAPAELLLILLIFFGLAAIVLLALSIEAGNYRELTEWYHAIKRRTPRPRRTWYFNNCMSGRSDNKLTSYNER